MYKRYPALDPETQEALLNLSTTVSYVEAKSHRRRMGANGASALSIYSSSRYFSWDAKTRETFKSLFPAAHRNGVVWWFLKFPEKKGFLDLQTTWIGKPQSGTIISYALNDGQSIIIGDEAVTLKKGEGIGFNLQIPHEVPKGQPEQLWACAMILGAPTEEHLLAPKA